MRQIGFELKNRTPISILKLHYGKTVNPEMLDWTVVWRQSEEPVRDYCNWLFSFLRWCFDESDRVPPSSYLIWLCYYSENLMDTENGAVLDFFLRRVTYKGHDDDGKFRRLGNCLQICEKKDMQCYMLRLLNAGAIPLLKSGLANDLYHSRLAARAAALALLLVAKRRGDLRGIVAQELWRDMAERVWANRFEN